MERPRRMAVHPIFIGHVHDRLRCSRPPPTPTLAATIRSPITVGAKMDAALIQGDRTAGQQPWRLRPCSAIACDCRLRICTERPLDRRRRYELIEQVNFLHKSRRGQVDEDGENGSNVIIDGTKCISIDPDVLERSSSRRLVVGRSSRSSSKACQSRLKVVSADTSLASSRPSSARRGTSALTSKCSEHESALFLPALSRRRRLNSLAAPPRSPWTTASPW